MKCHLLIPCLGIAVWSNAADNQPPAEGRPGSPIGVKQSESTLFPRPYPKPATIPMTMKAICGEDPAASFRVRLDAVHRQGTMLTDAEIEALYWLLHKKDADDKIAPGEMNALKNDVSSLLFSQAKRPTAFTTHLYDLFYDESQNIVWRDYCVQFLSLLYAKETLEWRARIKKVMWDGIKEPKSSVAGTCLIGLYRRAELTKEERVRLWDHADAMAFDSKRPQALRMTALQIVAESGDKAKLPRFRKIAADTTEPINVRMSAIGGIGLLGNMEDLKLLEPYRTGSDTRLRTAATAATRRIAGEKPQ